MGKITIKVLERYVVCCIFILHSVQCLANEKDAIATVKSFAQILSEYNIFSKKGIRNSQSNMQTSSISPPNRTKILSLQIRRDGTCVKKYFSLLAQSYTWASTSIQGFG